MAVTEYSASRKMVGILLQNGVDFKGIKENISSLLEKARENDDFAKNYDFYKVILPLYKASIALEAVSKNLSAIDDTLLNGHLTDIVRAESVLERMIERTTDVDLGSKILNLLSQIIPVALISELSGVEEQTTKTSEPPQEDRTHWKGN